MDNDRTGTPEPARTVNKRHRVQVAASCGGAVAAVGLLLMQLLVAREDLTGFLHGVQVFLVLLAAASAVGLALTVPRGRRKKER
ncbi:MAG: hypothetical protein LUD76_08745 [Alistipes sp.]|nr:hypothetical protein [Alistipes sp.]